MPFPDFEEVSNLLSLDPNASTVAVSAPLSSHTGAVSAPLSSLTGGEDVKLDLNQEEEEEEEENSKVG